MVYVKVNDYMLLVKIALNTPENVPQRFKYMRSQFVENRSEELKQTTINVELGYKIDRIPPKDFDWNSDLEFSKVLDHVKRNPHVGLYFMNYHEPVGLTLVTKREICCGQTLNTPAKGYEANMFTLDGTKKCRVLVSNCKICGLEFYPYYSERVADGKTFRTYDKPEEYFVSSRQTVFQTKYLRQVTINCELSGDPFNSHTIQYNRTHVDDDSLNRTVLEDGFFLFNIAQRMPDQELQIVRSTKDRTLDIEKICQLSYPPAKLSFVENWRNHMCQDKGCSMRAFIEDGNEKCNRLCCSAPAEKVISPDKSSPNYYKRCINNPARGDPKFDRKKGNTLCQEHLLSEGKRKGKKQRKEENESCSKGNKRSNGEGENKETCSKKMKMGSKESDNNKVNPDQPSQNTRSKSGKTSGQLDLNETTRAFGCQIEECGQGIATGEGCRPESRVKRFTTTTAGIISICRSCGLRLNMVEMFTAESLPQLCLCCVDTMGEDPCENCFALLALDRACDFFPYLKNLAENGNRVAQRFLLVFGFTLDKWHGDKHVKSVCDPEDTTTEFSFHPDSPELECYKGINLEAGERNFREVNKTKHTTVYMTYGRRLWYYLIIDDEHNRKLEELMIKKGTLQISGQPSWWKGTPLPKGFGDFHPKVLQPHPVHSFPTKPTGNGGMLLFCGKLANFGEVWKPVQFSSLSGVKIVHVSIGPTANHIFAVSEEGKVYAWGKNDYGQLGLGDRIDRASPTLLESLHIPITEIATGKSHSLFLSNDGQVFSCGNNEDGQCGKGIACLSLLKPEKIESTGDIFTSISCGSNFSVMLSKNGQLYSFGSSQTGQLGRLGAGTVPAIIKDFFVELEQLPETPEIINVSCGASHVLAIDMDGRTYSWGEGKGGKLGHGAQKKTLLNPTSIGVLSESKHKLQKIVCGANFTIGVKSNGNLIKFGSCESSSKVGNSTPILLHALRYREVVALACNSKGYFATVKNGEVIVCIQGETNGEIGIGPEVKTCARPVIIPSLKNVLFCGSGQSHTVFVCDSDKGLESFDVVSQLEA